MSYDINRQWVLRERPVGLVGREHFEWREGKIPEPDDNEILVRNHYVSFEPAQRGWLNDVPSYVPPVRIGEVMRSAAVGQVVKSRNPDYQEGEFVTGTFGWQDYIATDGAGMFPIARVGEVSSITYPLHIYGITGMTAYFGMMEYGKPVQGEVVVVSGAAGATGSVTGQIARLHGCTVIGIAGGPEKCRWLTEQANFDHAIDYRNESVAERLKELCNNRVDLFFDNVGGSILDDVLGNLSLNARVVLCGGISSGYTAGNLPPGPANYMQLVIRRSTMCGFLVLDFLDRFPQAIEQMKAWVGAGKIHVEEDIVEGLENCPETLAGLFQGRNFGKQLLKVTPA
ncbi:NADP-dependent oxidoreductase [Parahaliea aestuarii]|uniref:NADP-dependent oxidoreductase n=1 Tax=Parahaliea aestuarii TaxID=1852021 RepID=A0A5C9A4W5_9GAMM|nr:NADP-dependent oxidoreductase [Parahaliea aestuarii]TXS95064.1 NADP-dependent oxidoreductase [Parahaliea aestuarii]